LLLVGLLGVMAGASISEASRIVVRHVRDRHETPPTLTEEDRAILTDEFATHTTAVWSQVRQFADALADGDVTLREQLRRFEGGR
jgi:hypothetical protein